MSLLGLPWLLLLYHFEITTAIYQIHDFKNIRIGGVFETAENKNAFLVRSILNFSKKFFIQ